MVYEQFWHRGVMQCLSGSGERAVIMQLQSQCHASSSVGPLVGVAVLVSPALGI